MPVCSVQYITLVKNPDMEQNVMAVVTDNAIIFRGCYFLKHMLSNHPGGGISHVFLRKITEFRQFNPLPFLKNAPHQPPAVKIRKVPPAGGMSDKTVLIYPVHDYAMQFIDYAMQFIDYAMQFIDYAMYFSPGAFLSVYLKRGNAVLSISQKDATKVACSVVIFASVTVRRNDCIRL